MSGSPMTPADVLLMRADSHFSRALLELAAGDVQSAAEWIEKGLALVREVVER